MIRTLLLDCERALEERLKAQGFNVESGTVGFCTGTRALPSQLYEKDVIFYDPTHTPENGIITENSIEDTSPQYGLRYLEPRLQNGATVVVFLNPISRGVEAQQVAYEWIPFMPRIEFTSDKVIIPNRFEGYPDEQWNLLAPVVTTENLELPVLRRIIQPKSQPYENDIFALFWNELGQCLGVLILRGRGRLIVLPRFRSNEDVIETFLHRVLPKLYNETVRTSLVDQFVSPDERNEQAALKELDLQQTYLRDRQNAARVQLATATRRKTSLISADETAKQILIYYDNARRHADTALYYLYKVVESIENKLGGEAAGIAALGVGTEWKAIKRLANESYRDARHAPKPSDVIKKWTDAEIKKCFADTEKVVAAYFATLF